MPDARVEGLIESVSQALQADSELAQAVSSIIRKHPDTGPVFQQIVDHFLEAFSEARPGKRPKKEEDESVRKHNRTLPGAKDSNNHSSNLHNASPLLSISDLSFVTPIRKKLNLCIFKNVLRAFAPSEPSTVELQVEFRDIRHVALLPVPEKAAKLYNVCIFRYSTDESVVFTVPDGQAKNASCSIKSFAESEEVCTYATLITRVLNENLTNLQVAIPNTKDFVSANPQPHRRHESAVHVTAHRGSKEGYLFFLSAGLIYGFKRPLLFISLDEVSSITYNDILQRTFNLTISTTNREYEFSMIDIAEHDRVDKYVKTYQLSDASLSESRRAQRKKEEVESEISKAADEIAASITGHEQPEEEEEADENFEDDGSHDGSTLGSDESDSASETDGSQDIELSDGADE